MKALSKLQKSVLAQIARRAYALVSSTAAEPLPPFNDWRRQEVAAACGRHGLTEAENKHYNAIAAHFESLLGHPDRALNHLMRESTDRRRQLETCLLQALERAGLSQIYAERICQDRFKCSVADTDDHQLEQVLVTIRTRAAERRRRQAPPLPQDAPAAPEGYKVAPGQNTGCITLLCAANNTTESDLHPVRSSAA